MDSANVICFSCVITCYNREDLIERAIQSILNQTYQSFEIIVVDDGSADKSVEKINAIKDPRIKLIRHAENQGQNVALNTGVKAAKYNYLAFLDSDDIWKPDYLNEMQKIYHTHPQISFAYCSIADGPLWTLEGSGQYAEVLNQGFLSSMITITVKKNAVEEIGGFDPRYSVCQDDDFCFRLAERYSFKVIPDHLAVVYGDHNSLTRQAYKVALGWEFLFNDYKKDILKYCGPKVFSKHILNVSAQFFHCNSISKGLYYYMQAVYYYLLPQTNQKFDFSGKVFFEKSREVFKYKLSQIRKKLRIF